jgi:hypothetical protein
MNGCLHFIVGRVWRPRSWSRWQFDGAKSGLYSGWSKTVKSRRRNLCSCSRICVRSSTVVLTERLLRVRTNFSKSCFQLLLCFPVPFIVNGSAGRHIIEMHQTFNVPENSDKDFACRSCSPEFFRCSWPFVEETPLIVSCCQALNDAPNFYFPWLYCSRTRHMYRAEETPT